MIFTGLIIFTGQQTAREALETEKVLVAARDIAADNEISLDIVKEVEVPARMVRDEWITVEERDLVRDKIIKFSILEGQFIDERFLRKGVEAATGHVGVVIFIDIANSADAEAGDLVDIHYISKDRGIDVAPILAKNIRVLRAITDDGEDKPLVVCEKEMAGMGAREDKAIALMLCIPQELAEKVVFHAAGKSLYLVRSAG